MQATIADSGAIALVHLHPLPLKPRKSRPQSDRIGISGFAQYARALHQFGILRRM
ncbi:hypothetical protein QUA42_21400 [Microcoleus sp. Pol11C2]|uniref:hypothetical protein n=1 Tax=Microcoleus sp. Pol11C2 TaxID=3055389 RepID=UPI002FD77F69